MSDKGGIACVHVCVCVCVTRTRVARTRVFECAMVHVIMY